jgi:hypothetical protein
MARFIVSFFVWPFYLSQPFNHSFQVPACSACFTLEQVLEFTHRSSSYKNMGSVTCSVTPSRLLPYRALHSGTFLLIFFVRQKVFSELLRLSAVVLEHGVDPQDPLVKALA